MEKVCLSPREAAEALSLGVRTLARLRERGEGPRFINVGRSVRYPRCWSQRVVLQWRWRPGLTTCNVGEVSSFC
jgi:hypothetical protein